ncbi:MAG: glycine cleavage system protein GcvH [Pseudomonadota bacterium]
MKFPDDCHYHPEHMWVRRDGDIGVIGVSDFAQQQLGEVSLVSVPEPGSGIEQGGVFGSIESTKVASDLFAPVSGVIVEVNPKLSEEPWLVNDDAYGAGWIARVRLNDAGEVDKLLGAADYQSRIA